MNIYIVTTQGPLKCGAIDGRSFLKKHAGSVFMNENLYCISEDDLEVVQYNVMANENEIRGESIGRYKKSSKQFSAINFRDRAIIVSGGQRRFRTSKTVLSFSPLKRSYTKLAPLNDSRHSHAACELNGKLYVFGGLTKLGSPV